MKPSKAKDETSWTIDAASAGGTLASRMARALLLSQEDAADLIDFGSVQVNGRQERLPTRTLQPGDVVQVHWPLRGTLRHYEIDPLRILFQDGVLLVYDKERGVPSQQTPYDAYNNLYAGLLRHLGETGPRRSTLGLHHRLDRETTGVMVFTLDSRANRNLGRAFESRRVLKDYLAWVGGIPPRDAWTREDEIGRKAGQYATVPRGRGRPAETRFEILYHGEDRSLVRARPLTGRTHQIRLHLAASGCPVLGDRLHGGGPWDFLCLHAHRLSLLHPISGRRLEWTAPIPPDWPEPRQAATPGEPRS
ncbi:MAG: RluA family pseudouridine synthase [Syntrophobacteraceae bacterium]|nr:RluA family pseudouridine synthase [Syntrophobacteraceae bacterium]